MKSSGKRWIVWIALVVLALACLAVLTKSRRADGPSATGEKPTEASDSTGDSGPRLPDARTSGAREHSRENTGEDGRVSAGGKLPALLLAAMEEFRSNPDQDHARGILAKLREAIRAAPDEEAAAAILAFLKSGEDAATGLPFTVGEDGMMDTVPSLRLALLDLLPSLAPTAALEMAREIMDGKSSPDEYAISLRNLAWNDLDGDLHRELSGRFLDLLETPWIHQPTAGVLEAFDIPVEVGGKPMFDRLVSLAKDATAEKNASLTRATYMTLDRMILRDPAVLKSTLEDNASWMEFAPMQRASLMSRLDITQPWQRDLFLRYLSTTRHGTGELDYFAKVFPNGNYLYGHRLVTADEATPSIDEVAAADSRVAAELRSLGSSASGEAAEIIRRVGARLAVSSDPESEESSGVESGER